MQAQLNEIVQYATHNEMRVNIKKTKILQFNTAKVRDFTQDIQICGEKVEQAMLLGVKITSANTDNIVEWDARSCG